MYKSREEVVQAIEEAWRIVTSNGPNNPMIAAYSRSWFTPDVLEVLSKIIVGEYGGYDLQYLRDKKLQYQENALCHGPGDHGYLASVSKLDRSGEICVSVFGLMKSATSGLRNDLIALFLHEFAHLNGFGETDARNLQKAALSTMGRLLRTQGEELKRNLENHYKSEIKNGWLYLVNFDEITDARLSFISDIELRIRNYDIPNPLTGPELNVPHPQMYESLITQRDGIIDGIRQYGTRLGQKLDQNSNAQLDATDLNAAKKIAVEIVGLYANLLKYLRDVNESMQSDLDAIEKATNSKILKAKDRMYNVGPMVCDMERIQSQKKNRYDRSSRFVPPEFQSLCPPPPIDWDEPAPPPPPQPRPPNRNN